MAVNVMKEFKVTFLILIFISGGCLSTSELIIKPRDTEAVVGHRTYLNCSTSNSENGIQWYYYPLGSVETTYIYLSGRLQQAYKGRTRVEQQIDGSFNLVIDRVQRSDAGKYLCQEEGEQVQYSSAELIVLEAPPVCEVLSEEDGFIGPNSCGLQIEDILLSCKTEYLGNIPPTIEWRNDEVRLDSHSVSNTKTVTSELAFSSESMKHQSSYICQTSKSTIEQYSCTVKSEGIPIIYAFNNFSASEMSVGDTATCSAESNLPCSYRWIWNHEGHSSVISNNSKVTLKYQGLYRCEAECTVRNKQQCRVIAGQIISGQVQEIEKEIMLYRVHESPDETTVCVSCGSNGTSQWKVSFITIPVILLVIGVPGLLLFARRKKQRARTKKVSELGDPENGINHEETDNLMSTAQQLAPNTKANRVTEIGLSAIDRKERRNGLGTIPKDVKVEYTKSRQQEGKKSSTELPAKELPSSNENNRKVFRAKSVA